ncbi:YeeE/YedE family protein [Novosphingobium mangrovi (ex Huang et al. 2023)]|uniref:YeeE/YedE family protein n=1 Tax=Novosphingobium mangrovi (ex Huang et al. 2023) TaxID=2976432 RepID=A0ABT2I1T7_9SPHN|nr:YeeE/YedE family protein [Novosphingobium mangrovi (ex Huang et al. 2023)]MCT2398777.1 YeeE/YedE family protein [Novosphingobium mangrovi (ex Huang et al. 2023)]
MLTLYIAPLLGGIVIGLTSGGLYLLMGEIAGITGIARSAIIGPSRGWQMAFIAGLLASGGIAALMLGGDFTAGIEGIPLPVLALAGLLVGLGTDLGNGCTSGHGVCGLSRLSLRSLAAVGLFMVSAGLTVFLLRHGGF